MPKKNPDGLPSVEDLRKLDLEALKSNLQEQRIALMQARFKHATAQLEKTSDLKNLRRQIARISTIINEKK